MHLEIVDNLKGKAHIGRDGFMILTKNGATLSSLVTAQGLYVAERTDAMAKAHEVATSKNKTDILTIISTWLNADEKHLLDRAKYDGFIRIKDPIKVKPLSDSKNYLI